MTRITGVTEAENQKRAAARIKFDDLITKAKNSGKPLTEGEQRCIVYQGRLAEKDEETIMEVLRELNVTEVADNLPIPTGVKLRHRAPVPTGPVEQVAIPKPVRELQPTG